MSLKKIIQKWVDSGKLDRFVKGARPSGGERAAGGIPELRQPRLDLGVITEQDYELQVRRVTTRQELFERAYDVAIAEERKEKKKEKGSKQSDAGESNKGSQAKHNDNNNKGKNRTRAIERVPETFTPLTVSKTEIMNSVELGSPAPMNPSNKFRRDNNKYC